jgi:hypothetical protein
VRRLTGKERMESPADWPVPGLLAHIPGQGEKGFRVVDVRESQEAVDAFAAKLIPVLEEIGVQGRPEVYSAHTSSPPDCSKPRVAWRAPRNGQRHRLLLNS